MSLSLIITFFPSIIKPIYMYNSLKKSIFSSSFRSRPDRQQVASGRDQRDVRAPVDRSRPVLRPITERRDALE